MVKSACGIEAVYMCFNGTGIWGGETLYGPATLTELDHTTIYRNVALSSSSLFKKNKK